MTVGGNDGLSARLAALPPDKRALAEKLLAQRGFGRFADVPRQQPGEPMALTVKQAALWALHRGGERGCFYHVGILIHAAVPADRLAAAFDSVALRHEVFRTRYVDGTHAVVDWSAPRIIRNVAATPHAAAQLATDAGRAPFSLAEPPIRVMVTDVGSLGSCLAVIGHDIALDSYGLRQILVPELRLVLRGDPWSVPPPLRPRDLAVWQRNSMDGGDISSQVDYWRTQLDGARLLDVVTRGDRRKARIPVRLRVHSFAETLALWAVALGREFGRDRIPVGVCTSGRLRPETEQVLANLSNTVIFHVSSHGSLAEVTRLSRVCHAAAMAHADAPYEHVLPLVAGVVHKPVADEDIGIRLTYHNRSHTSEKAVLFDDFRVYELDFGYAKSALSLELEAVGDALVGSVDYRPAAVPDIAARRLAETLMTEWGS